MCGLSCPAACGVLVAWPGIEPTSPTLEGGFLTTGPPAKPLQGCSCFSSWSSSFILHYGPRSFLNCLLSLPWWSLSLVLRPTDRSVSSLEWPGKPARRTSFSCGASYWASPGPASTWHPSCSVLPVVYQPHHAAPPAWKCFSPPCDPRQPSLNPLLLLTVPPPGSLPGPFLLTHCHHSSLEVLWP